MPRRALLAIRANRRPAARPRSLEPSPAVAVESKLLTEAEAATYIRMSRAYLAKDRLGAKLVPFLRIGNAVRYERSGLDYFISSRRVA